MKNNYGNYVVQKALKLSKGNYKTKLINSILKNIQKIGDKKIILKWKTIVECHLFNLPGFNFGLMNNNIDNMCPRSGTRNNTWNYRVPNFLDSPNIMNNLKNNIYPGNNSIDFNNSNNLQNLNNSNLTYNFPNIDLNESVRYLNSNINNSFSNGYYQTNLKKINNSGNLHYFNNQINQLNYTNDSFGVFPQNNFDQDLRFDNNNINSLNNNVKGRNFSCEEGNYPNSQFSPNVNFNISYFKSNGRGNNK